MQINSLTQKHNLKSLLILLSFTCDLISLHSSSLLDVYISSHTHITSQFNNIITKFISQNWTLQLIPIRYKFPSIVPKIFYLSSSSSKSNPFKDYASCWTIWVSSRFGSIKHENGKLFPPSLPPKVSTSANILIPRTHPFTY